MRLRSSSRCSIRLMPGRSARCVTACPRLADCFRGINHCGRRLRRLVRIFNGGFYHCVLFLGRSLFCNGSWRLARLRRLLGRRLGFVCGPGRGNRLAGRGRLDAGIASLLLFACASAIFAVGAAVGVGAFGCGSLGTWASRAASSCAGGLAANWRCRSSSSFLRRSASSALRNSSSIWNLKSFEALRNSYISLPIWRPICGSRRGPKTTSAITIRISESAMPRLATSIVGGTPMKDNDTCPRMALTNALWYGRFCASGCAALPRSILNLLSSRASPNPGPAKCCSYGCVKLDDRWRRFRPARVFLKLPASIRIQLDERAATTPWMGNS